MVKVNSKVQTAFDKLEKRFIVYPTSHDMEMIKNAMQAMYDLGHADGYADYYYDNVIDQMVVEDTLSGIK
jgi:hypothetical protein